MNTYKMTLEDSVDSMTFDLLEVPIVDKDVEGAVDNTTLDGNIFTDYLWLKKNYVQKWSIMCDDEYSRLRGFYTRQFDNASVPTYKLFYGENISQDQVVSGDYILVDNTTERNAPITSFELLGDAEQTTYSGKNLADLVPITNGTIANIAYATTETVFDSTLQKNVLHIAATGTFPTANYTLPERLESDKYYSLTVKYRSLYTGTNPSNYQDFWFAPNWSGNNWDTLGSLSNGKNQTGSVGARIPQSTSWTIVTMRFHVDPTQYATSTTPYSRINFSLGNGIVNNTTAKEVWIADTMIHEITQAEYNATNYIDEDFEPYVGGTASPNPDYPQDIQVVTGEQTVEITGKNLYSDTWENGGISASTGANNSDANIRTVNYVPVLASTTYTASCDTGTRIALRFYNSAGTFLGAGATSSANTNTFTTPADTARVRFVVINASGTTPNFQLELGSTATTYEPYQGQSYTIDLGSIELVKIGNYQDRIYKDAGKWYVEKQVGKAVLDGTESAWRRAQFGSTGKYYYTFGASWGQQTTNGKIVLSDYFKAKNTWSEQVVGLWLDANIILTTQGSLSDSETLNDFKSWLSTHNTTVYYALATPTTTEITNSELVGQLEAILQAYLYTGTNNVSNNAVSPNLAGQMNIGYKLIFSEETVLIEPTAVRLTLTDGGIINVCGCRQNVQLTMRETIQ